MLSFAFNPFSNCTQVLFRTHKFWCIFSPFELPKLSGWSFIGIRVECRRLRGPFTFDKLKVKIAWPNCCSKSQSVGILAAALDAVKGELSARSILSLTAETPTRPLIQNPQLASSCAMHGSSAYVTYTQRLRFGNKIAHCWRCCCCCCRCRSFALLLRNTNHCKIYMFSWLKW